MPGEGYDHFVPFGPSAILRQLIFFFSFVSSSRLIEFASQDDADSAIRKLDGTELKGMVVTLVEDVGSIIQQMRWQESAD
jgi:hypothetical protein